MAFRHRAVNMNAMRVTSVPAPAVPAADGFGALDACHRRILATLDELSALVLGLEVDGPTPEARHRAARIADFFSTTAREHHEDEERHLFPVLVAGGRPEVVQAVLRLQQDHDWLEEGWFDLAPHVLAVASGRPGWDIGVLRDGVPVLAALYRDHIELEESFIYPEARTRMPGAQRGDMGREMAARHRAARQHA
jgi:hemerythrin-like domain-containing protein